MTLSEARRVFSSRPAMGDPATAEAAKLLGQVPQVKATIVRHFGSATVKRPMPGSAFSKHLKAYQDDVVETAFAELGVE